MDQKDENKAVEIPLVELTCLRCHYTWVPRVITVKMCPRCKSSYWDSPKSEKSWSQYKKNLEESKNE